MELVAESGVVSVVGTCQRVVELHEIRCREWSMRAALVATRQRVVELHGIHCREWSGRAALVVTCQRARIRRLEIGWDI